MEADFLIWMSAKQVNGGWNGNGIENRKKRCRV